MLKILIVDDERIVIDGLISMLDWNSFEGKLVGTASSGEETLAQLDSLKPDVIISDIKMDGMNGIELSKTLHERHSAIQLIFFSAHGEFEYAQKAIQYGVIDYILKPITREKIQQLTALLIQKNEQLARQKKRILSTWGDMSLKERLLGAIRGRDKSALDEFFQSSLFEELLSGTDGNAIGVQLLDYLYRYLSEIKLSPEALSYSRENTMREFLDLTDRREKMDFIITKYYDMMTSITQQTHSHSDTITAYALRYISAHYMDPDFNLSALSYAMHVSLSHLSTVFKQTTGNNLSTYVTELRMDKAKDLLADMQHSISEVAALSGYNDTKYFTKLFKKKNGCTPGEYRNLAIRGGRP